jgi:hypothetical protein
MRALRLKVKMEHKPELFSWEGLSWTVLLCGLVALLSVQKAHAQNLAGASSSSATLPNGMPTWTDTTQYDDCGQNCLYDHANENLTLQATYMIKKSENLIEIFGDGSDTVANGKIVDELKLYCPNNAGNSDQNSAQQCLSAYLTVQASKLRQIKTLMGKNEDNTARLKSQVTVLGKSSISTGHTDNAHSTAFQDSTQGIRKAQIPQFMKEDALVKTAGTPNEEMELQRTAGEKYNQWEQANFKTPPQLTDYPVPEVVADPNNPKSEPITRIKRNPDGTPVYDKKAYLAALASYKLNDEPLINQVVGKVDPKERVGALEDPSLLGKKPPAQADTLDSLSYKEARKLAIDAETPILNQQNVRTVNFGANQSNKTMGKTPPKVNTPASSNAEQRDTQKDNGSRPTYLKVGDIDKRNADPTLDVADPAPETNAIGNVHRHTTVTLDSKQIDDAAGEFEGFAKLINPISAQATTHPAQPGSAPQSTSQP